MTPENRDRSATLAREFRDAAIASAAMTPFAIARDEEALDQHPAHHSEIIDSLERELGRPFELAPTAVTSSLVIPTKNEGRNLPYVLEHLPECVDEIVIVDSSTDATPIIIDLMKRDNVRVVHCPEPGKGSALRAGFAAALGELVIAMDADGSMSPDEIPQLIYFLEHGYDFVKGSRFIGGGGSLDITPIRRAGNKMLLGIANKLFETNLTDLCYGFFGFRRCFLDVLALRSTGFEIETEITVRAVLAGLRICELPSLELPRRRGRSNLHAISDGQRVLSTLLNQRFISR